MALPTIRVTDANGNNVLGVGFTGDSAYQTAVKNGFEGTEQEWLESLRGPRGEEGPPGIQGPKGADGTMSFEDLTPEQRESLRGPQGVPGPKGEDSTVPGPQGIQGPKGNDGISPTLTTTPIDGGYTLTITDANGTNSINIMNGAKGDKGDQGTKGDTYTITTADYDAIANVVFGKMTNASEVRY